jgi:methylenetetrahydrofolate dehydrogenase (NADP+)/methenyltetrahydrofolate cyclohydrolase
VSINFSKEFLKMDKPLILEGKKIAAEMQEELKQRVVHLISKSGKKPILATILVGTDPASVTYVRMKGNACGRVGMDSLKIEMPENSTTEQVLAEINDLNKNKNVHGILLQHPLPDQVDEQLCFNTIALEKDVDGVNATSFGRMAMGQKAYFSATPLAILTILKYYNIPLQGKEAVVVGRSPILGKPVAMMLLNENATVTICHSKTQNLPGVVKRADIVVGAVGKPKFIKADWIKKGAVVIDAGYNPGNVGDTDLEAIQHVASAYTPVPGGVGPMTIISLIRQTVEAAEKYYGIQ